MGVRIDNRHPQLRVDKRRLGAHLRSVLQTLGHGRDDVDVSLVTDAEIHQLNRDWRRVDAVTDVLSFALREAGGPASEAGMLGDLVVSLDTAARQVALVREANAAAPETAVQGYGLAEEVLFLATHGLLHLLGHDHQEPAEAAVMAELERRFMADVTPLDVQACDRTGHGAAPKVARARRSRKSATSK